MAMKPHSKSPISSAKSRVGMLFKDISPSPHESELRLIHFSSTNSKDRPNELKYLSTMLVVAARTNFEEMDLLAYCFGGCNHFEHHNSFQYLLGNFQGLGSHGPQLQGGAWDDEYENDDDDYAEKWTRRGNDGNWSASGSFGLGSDRSKVWKPV
ncbi:unnamed protein product [Brassica rapa]|uniref:Uncharacterized protein n=1 Tax=Brassica campestris TaxID=3711 RepID=A0A3P6A919_BRACM|nr:unnamed protein product [Brassica rapa]VDC83964.1 unnamed protein product [Brassica rapa]